MKRPNVLIACESSGRVRLAFQRAGCNAWSCDRKPNALGHDLWHYQCDVRRVLDHYADRFDLMIAHPDCTFLTQSGVRWMAGGTNTRRLAQMQDAVDFYLYLWRQPIGRICIENPVMHGYAARALADLPKRQFVQPWWFGEKMFKRTGYSLKNLPQLEPTNRLTPPEKGTSEHKKWSWVHRCAPGPARKTIRSRTPQSIADAMAAQWSLLL